MTPNPDLASIVLSLSPLESQPAEPGKMLPRWWGRAAHAMFLETIREQDSALARSLHDEKQTPKSFTASTLMGSGANKKLDPKHEYTLRFTTFDEPVTACLLAAIRSGGNLSAGSIIELDYIPLRISAVYTTRKEHPWAGVTSYQELSSPYLLAKTDPDRRFRLLFASPVTFKTAGKYFPFPSPSLTYNSLLNRWNTYAPVSLPPEVREFAESCLAVSRYRLATRSVPVKSGGFRSGCTGEIQYTATRYDRYWLSLITLLTTYTLFTGLGAGTGMGMGQTRMLESTASPRKEA